MSFLPCFIILYKNDSVKLSHPIKWEWQSGRSFFSWKYTRRVGAQGLTKPSFFSISTSKWEKWSSWMTQNDQCFHIMWFIMKRSETSYWIQQTEREALINFRLYHEPVLPAVVILYINHSMMKNAYLQLLLGSLHDGGQDYLDKNIIIIWPLLTYKLLNQNVHINKLWLKLLYIHISHIHSYKCM